MPVVFQGLGVVRWFYLDEIVWPSLILNHGPLAFDLMLRKNVVSKEHTNILFVKLVGVILLEGLVSLFEPLPLIVMVQTEGMQAIWAACFFWRPLSQS